MKAPQKSTFSRGAAAAIAAVMVAALTGCTFSQVPSETYHFGDEPIEWVPCDDPGPVPSLECATYSVPMDYRDGDSPRIALALRKAPATGERKGALFFNPGGPGGTGSGQFPLWYGHFPAEVRSAYDIVSWDPRGVGESAGVQCYPNAEAEAAAIGSLGSFPLNYVEQEAFFEGYTAFARQCKDQEGDLLKHISTADTARDLEQLRIALGNEPLNYWGVSYGTFLGATYANMFPDQLRALVLDGNVSPLAWIGADPATDWESVGMRIGSTDNADVFDQFLVLCSLAGTEDCAFAEPTPDLTRQKWVALANRLREHPALIERPSGSVVMDLSTLVGQLSSGLDMVWEIPGSATGWRGVATALQTVADAPPAPDRSEQPGNPSTTPTPYAGGEQALAVTCGDAQHPPAERLPSLTVEAFQKAELFGLATLYNDVPCSFWDVAAAEPYRGPWDRELSAVPLVVSTTHDPSTPIRNAAQTAELLNGVLLTVDGYGHTTLLNPSTCANDAIAHYILTGTAPTDPIRCAQDVQPFQ